MGSLYILYDCNAYFAGVEVGAVAGVFVGALAGASVFLGAYTFGKDCTGLAVRTTLKIITTTTETPRVHVAFSIKSLVLCTPNCAEDAPPNVEERPPPFGF